MAASFRHAGLFDMAYRCMPYAGQWLNSALGPLLRRRGWLGDITPPPDIRSRFNDYRRTAAAAAWRTLLLRLRSESISNSSLDHHIQGSLIVTPRLMPFFQQQGTGVIFASPHYGPFLDFALLLAATSDAARMTHIFYDSPAELSSNARFDEIFQRFPERIRVLHNSPRGVIAALRGLRNGNSLGIMYDVLQHPEKSIAVPFMNRLYPAMPGTAFLAMRANATIVPVYAVPDEESFRSRVELGEPIFPADHAAANEDQFVFNLTCALFRDFERQLHRAPWHWVFWENLTKASLFDPECLRHAGGLGREIAKRCELMPPILRLVPMLGDLLPDDAGAG